MKYPIIVLMNLTKALGSLFLLATLTFVPSVLAGGGPVYISLGSTLASWNNPSSPRQIVAKVHLHPDVPCVGTKVTFKYEDQKDGDNVSTGADGNAYVIQEVGARWLNGKSVYDCGTYAKYTSKNKELKYGIIIVSTPKGEIHKRKVALNFQNNDPIISSDDTLPWDNEISAANLSTPTNLRVTQIETTADPNTRNVHIMWDPVKGATSYVIYKNAGSSYYYHTTVDTNLYEMKINKNSVFYISVSAKKNDVESTRSQVLTIDLAQEKISDSAPSGNIYIKVGAQKYLGGPKRQVTLSWSSVSNAVKYNVYARLADTKDYGAAIEGTGSLSTQVGINAFLDYYVKVDACNSAGCVSSNEVFVPKMKKEDGGTVIIPSPSTVATSSINNSSTDELNKKLENLQNQLEESKQRQGILETRLNQLISWIKSILPFFK